MIITVKVSYIYSQSVSFSEAEQVARNFFGKTHKSLQNCADISVKGTDTLFYVFNSDNGFVIVSADKKAIPILAYSTENVYDAQNVIPPAKMWLDYYENQLYAIVNDKLFTQNEQVNNSWKELQQSVPVHKSNVVDVIPPLLTSKWGQGEKYNFYCPKDENNKKAVTGCVATAMAQLMYYFRFPQNGSGTYTYTHADYGEISADFGSATYDYSSMTDRPSGINPDIALLMFHCGVAVDMDYGVNASGMWNHSAANSLKNYFNFSPKTQYIFRETTNLDWDSLIISHLDKKIPLYYAGWDTGTSGHAFICDGYQIDSSNNYYYHFNFGWDGKDDNYYYTGSLYPSGYNFNLRQELIINAYPDTVKYTYPSHQPLTGDTLLVSEAGSFSVGMLYDCPKNLDYTWVVRPDVDDIKNILVNLSYRLAEKDTLFITSSNGTVIYTFTNDTSAFFQEIVDTELVFRLKTTNALVFSGGLTASYNANRPIYCTRGLNTQTSKNGTIDDKSGNSRYNNFTDCVYAIYVKSASTITLYFSKFETEKDKDILYIYDFKSSGNILLRELSGILEDSVITFPTNALYFEFKTNEKNIYDGWTFYYDTDVTGVNSFEKENRVNIYPNPSNDDIFIEVSDNLFNGKMQLYDIYGKLLKEQIFTENILQVDIKNLASGLYFVKIIDDKNGVVLKKIVKE